MPGALHGVKVVEFASYVSGPYAGMLLADLGAEVIKIEAPDGDPFRGWGRNKSSPHFESVNRNKKSVVLDLKTSEGRDVAYRLAASCDVLIENFRVGKLEALGLGYDRLRGTNPRLIYCSITGFGADGPYKDRPGYDTVGQALGGLLGLLTDFSKPLPMGVSLSDHLSGVFACYGVLAALYARERTGKGQRIGTSLLEATAFFIGENAAAYFEDGKVPSRATRTYAAQVYAFVAQDGLPFVIHLSSPQKFWAGLAKAVGREDWLSDPRFESISARRKNYDALQGALGPIFASRPRAHWLERLQAQDVPCAPINTLQEVFDDPQVRHLGLCQEVEHPKWGRKRLIRGPVRFEGTPVVAPSAAPSLGEHNAELLGESPVHAL